MKAAFHILTIFYRFLKLLTRILNWERCYSIIYNKFLNFHEFNYSKKKS
jgi:hypothetical protein